MFLKISLKGVVSDGDFQRLVFEWWQFVRMTFADMMFDAQDYVVGAVFVASEHEPTRAFGNEEAENEDDQPEAASNAEGESPTDFLRDIAGKVVTEKKHRGDGASGSAEPERAVDDEIDRAA
jgi:hypothetical protein